MSKEPTLLQYYPVLKAKDKALICRALNEQREQGQGELHLGVLPFVSISRVADAVYVMSTKGINNRIWADLMAKLEVRRWVGSDETLKWEINLNPQKVAKRLGRRPDLGVTVPVVPRKTTRGPLKWNIGAKAWQPEKISAAPRITLRNLTPDIYEVAAPRQYADLIYTWLLDNCG